MTWWRPWSRKNQREAQRDAIAEADRKLAEAHARDPEVERLSRRLREIRERNNFAAMFAAAFREHR